MLAWLFRPQPVTVDLATVARGPLQVSVSDDGETRVRDMFVVSAPLAGHMRRIELEAGDSVVAGETIVARIEPSDPSFLDRRSEAEVRAGIRAGKPPRACGRRTASRPGGTRFRGHGTEALRGPRRSRTISQNDLESARRRARAAEAAVDEAVAGLRVSESELDQAKAR